MKKPPPDLRALRHLVGALQLAFRQLQQHRGGTDDQHPNIRNPVTTGGESMKTLAIRLDDELHAQLSVLAQLRNSTITDEIRLALETHLEASKSDTELTNRAQAVLDDIEREAEGRRAAIATLFGPTAEPTANGGKASNKQGPVPKGNAPG